MNSLVFALCTIFLYASELATAAIIRTRPDDDGVNGVANEYAAPDALSPELAQLALNPELQAYYYETLPHQYALHPMLPVNENLAADITGPAHKRAQTFVRFGKRAQTFVRFGKRAQTFVRFGRSGNKAASEQDQH
ncbi:FMRFamide-related peptide FLP-16 precursor [Aphelenchoides avenae]|nr:FMRFamide-related peptide FLP-16 precursor [Aphelenchus avenae]